MSHSSPLHGLDHVRLPYPSLSPRVAQIPVHWVSDTIQPSHPLLTTSFFTFNLFQHQGLVQLVCSCINIQNTGTSASASVFPVNIQDWFLLGLTSLISLGEIQGTLKSLLQHNNLKASILHHSAFLMDQLSHLYMTTRKTIALTIQTLLVKWCLCFFICCLGLS